MKVGVACCNGSNKSCAVFIRILLSWDIHNSVKDELNACNCVLVFMHFLYFCYWSIKPNSKGNPRGMAKNALLATPAINPAVGVLKMANHYESKNSSI